MKGVLKPNCHLYIYCLAKFNDKEVKGMVNSIGIYIYSEAFNILFVLLWPPEYCETYAKAENIGNAQEEDSSDDEVSDEDTSSEDEMAGHADP